jgi:tocopherol cyclase
MAEIPRPQLDGQTIARNLLQRWRITGADLPWGDPRLSHRAAMEGYLWRFTNPADASVVLVACGINYHPHQTWGSVVVATNRDETVRSASIDNAVADHSHYALDARPYLDFRDNKLTVQVDDAAMQVQLTPRQRQTRQALPFGLPSVIPGLNHYWFPHLFDANVFGTARIGERTWDLSGWQAYSEKSWGKGFPPAWWWGQAHGFDRGDLTIAFAGGLLGRGKRTVRFNALVFNTGSGLVRLIPPAAVVRGGVRNGAWAIEARSVRYRVRLTGEAADSPTCRLPVPALQPHHFNYTTHHLTGKMRLEIIRDGRLLYTGCSAVASLETGGALSTGHGV